MMLAELLMAVVQSSSEELMGRLRESLVQVIRGDADGFLSTPIGMRRVPPPLAEAASGPDHQPVFVKSLLESEPQLTKPALA
jgi:hypothetical protein